MATTTPTKKKKAPTRAITLDSRGNIDLYVGDRVHHPRLGDGSVMEITQKGRSARICFDDGVQRHIVLALAPVVRYLRPKKVVNDRVQVAFVYQGQQVETRVCARAHADKLGRQMVRDYAPVFDGLYIISELKPNPKVVPISSAKKKPKATVRPSAQYPKRPRHKVEVTHYFTIVT